VLALVGRTVTSWSLALMLEHVSVTELRTACNVGQQSVLSRTGWRRWVCLSPDTACNTVLPLVRSRLLVLVPRPLLLASQRTVTLLTTLNGIVLPLLVPASLSRRVWRALAAMGTGLALFYLLRSEPTNLLLTVNCCWRLQRSQHVLPLHCRVERW